MRRRAQSVIKEFLPISFLGILLFLRVMFSCSSEELFSAIISEDNFKDTYIDKFTKAVNYNIRDLRYKISIQVSDYLPSPHKELLLGIVLGLDNINYVPAFKEITRETGTIHVVVVSGYNISLVISAIFLVLKSAYNKINVILVLVLSLFYSIFTGFEPPVIRAWVMGSFILLLKFYGRPVDILKVLLVSSLIILIFVPTYMYSLSFQLSFAATLSLILFSPLTSTKRWGSLLVIGDLFTTIFAQILVWPLIAYHFNSMTLLSPIVNATLLWTIPIATTLGGIFIATIFLFPFLAKPMSLVLYVVLDIFVRGVTYYYEHGVSSTYIKISSLFVQLYYFISITLGVLIYRKSFYKSMD